MADKSREQPADSAAREKVAREKLAEQILRDFRDKITGDTDEPVAGGDPEEQFFVGKLRAKSGDINNSYSSNVSIESVGADFYIDESEIETAEITVFPKGEFYYRCYPTLAQQRAAFLAAVNKDLPTDPFASFEDISKANAADSKSVKLVPVYKKVSIASPDMSVSFQPRELLDKRDGVLDEQSKENARLTERLNAVKARLKDDPDLYAYKLNRLRRKTTLQHLKTEEEYKEFLKNSKNLSTPVRQNWSVYIDVTVRKIKDKYLISVALINSSAGKPDKSDKDKLTVDTLFNAGLDISLQGADYAPIELDYFLDDYKYDKTQRAVGLNCSVVFDRERNMISTEHLPTFVQKRLITKDDPPVRFQDLVEKPLDTLRKIRKRMDTELKRWGNYYEEKKAGLTSAGRAQMEEEIAEFRREIARFQMGIDTLAAWPTPVLDSFVLMNRTFQAVSEKKHYDAWRLFQIVFIVSLIPDIVACDENIMTPEERQRTTLSEVSLLYFPTGGGKTEAFLGVLIFNLFFDRFRDKVCGVTAILRYPLRLLSVQQVQRLANTLAQAELLRRADARISDTGEFSLGYFVGDANTPNNIRQKQAHEYQTMPDESRDRERILDICPFCGQSPVHLKFDRESYRLIHYCPTPGCPSGGALPVYMVDTEIYRYLPSVIISTVDKLAILGSNRSFRNILSGAPCRCARHGFTSTGECLVPKEFCSEPDFEDVRMYDPAPTLFIQDELHLIRESLGTYASHYESFVDYYVQNHSPSRRKVKVIGATATISSYAEQIMQLYNGRAPIRFPCASPYEDENFYSFVNKADTQRLIMGYAPYGMAIRTAAVYSLKYMREVVNRYRVEPEKVLAIPGMPITTAEEALRILEDYWIFLEYNNVKSDGNNVGGAIETRINVDLRAENVPEFITRKMTGDESFQDVREVLAQVENTDNVFEGVNLIVATSMISHGVDADRFNVMFFYGVPGNTAEYIQAYSRTGRKHSSIVIDIIRPTRETDLSYLNNFVNFHKFKDILVEPVPINRWAPKAIDGTLPGIFAGLLLTCYDQELHFYTDSRKDSLEWMRNVKQAIQQGAIRKETVLSQLLQAYGCESGGDAVELGNQYRQRIEAFTDRIFAEIVDRSWTDKERISAGFERMGYHIMQSLRDTDPQLTIELA